MQRIYIHAARDTVVSRDGLPADPGLRQITGALPRPLWPVRVACGRIVWPRLTCWETSCVTCPQCRVFLSLTLPASRGRRLRRKTSMTC